MKNQTFTYEARGQVLIIHMPKELDHHNCKDLRLETDILMEENCIRRIVFDFSATEFMDSSGIGVLLGRYKQMKSSGGEAVYCRAGKQVSRILRVGGLEKLLKGLESLEEAVEEREET